MGGTSGIVRVIADLRPRLMPKHRLHRHLEIQNPRVVSERLVTAPQMARGSHHAPAVSSIACNARRTESSLTTFRIPNKGGFTRSLRIVVTCA